MSVFLCSLSTEEEKETIWEWVKAGVAGGNVP